MENVTNSFHHGGRAGDLFYALYTVKELGGGNVYLSDRQQSNWDKELILSTLPLVRYQDYVNEVEFIDCPHQEHLNKVILSSGYTVDIDYDLVDAERNYNPDDFPEWQPPHWPGNVHIAKRYAHAFGVRFQLNKAWLTAPKTKDVDVVFHAPMRRIGERSEHSFTQLLRSLNNTHKVVILGGKNDIEEWKNYIPDANYVVPGNFLVTADYINSAKVFLGAASSCNVIAEGLQKPRFVELASDCWNTMPSKIINGEPHDSILTEINKLL